MPEVVIKGEQTKMPTYRKFDRYMITIERHGCVYLEWKNGFGKCQLDGSRRGSCCWDTCPNCKPRLKDRLKAAWHVLTWNRRYIR